MTAPPADFRADLLAAPMSAFQIWAVAATVALCALDGFDVFAITFVAPALAREWGVGKAALGAVFSAGLVGMAMGSLFLAPLADTYGRRRLVIASLALMVAGTIWSALSPDIFRLAASRFCTGIGVGAMIAVINPLGAEYSSARRRDLSVTLLNLGFPAGGILGGAVAAWLLPNYGWQSIFVAASILGLIMLAVVTVWLPEPPTGLLRRPGAQALAGINAYLARCGAPALAQLPPTLAVKRSSFAIVLKGKGLRTTLRTTAVYFLFVLSIFYIQSWMPSLVASSGHSASQSALVSVWMNVGGILGGLVIGIAAARFGLKAMVATAMVGAALAIAAFGIIPPTIPWLTAMALTVGFFIIGGMANLYAVVSRSFPGAARASGTGFVIGVGRLGSALGPWFGGLLFASGFGRAEVSAALAVPALIAALIVLRSTLESYD